MNLTINSERTYSDACVKLRTEWEAHKYLRLAVKTGIDRSLEQNNHSHVWYAQISRELNEDSPLGVKCECKLRFGVPILRADDAEFDQWFANSIGKLDYEMQIKAMEFIDVTSLMTVRQLKKYLEDMQKDYSMRGVILNFPKE